MIMDKKTIMEDLARKAHEKGVFNGAWRYARANDVFWEGMRGILRDQEPKAIMWRHAGSEIR